MPDETQDEQRRREKLGYNQGVGFEQATRDLPMPELPTPQGLAPVEPLTGGPPPAQASTESLTDHAERQPGYQYGNLDIGQELAGPTNAAPGEPRPMATNQPGGWGYQDLNGGAGYRDMQGANVAPAQRSPHPPGMTSWNQTQPVDPEAGLRTAQMAVARATLSQPELLRLAKLQQGLNTIEEQVASGNLDVGHAAALRSQIAAQAQPLMIRQTELPGHIMRLQFQQMQHHAAMQNAIDGEHMRYLSQTAQQRLQTVTLPNGQTVSFMPDQHQRLYEITAERHAPPPQVTQAQSEQLRGLLGGHNLNAAQQRLPIEEQLQIAHAGATERYNRRLGQEIRSEEGVARRELEAARRINPQGRPEWWGMHGPEQSDEAAIRQHAHEAAIDRLGRAGIHPPQRPGTQPGGAPTTQAGSGASIFAPAGGAQPGNSQGNQPAANPLPSVATMRENLASDPPGMHPNMLAARRQMREWVNELHEIQQRHPVAERTPQETARVRQLDNLIGTTYHAANVDITPQHQALLDFSRRPGQVPHPLNPVSWADWLFGVDSRRAGYVHTPRSQRPQEYR